jgi:hypothetical protein
MTAFLLSLFLISAPPAGALPVENHPPDTLWRVERQHVLEGLRLMNLTPADLEYDKQWIPDSFRLKVVSDLLDHPLWVPDYVLYSGREVKKCTRASDYPCFTCREITQKTIQADAFKARDLEGLVRETFTLTQGHLERAFGKLSKAERDSLIYTAPTLWSDEADSLVHGYAGALQKEFGRRDTGDSLKRVSVLRLAKRVDIVELHRAGATLAEGVERMIPLAKELLKNGKPVPVHIDGVEGDIYAVYDLPENRRVVVGGPGRNVYTGEFAGIIDLGGNDLYEGRVAGAVGELGNPVSFVLDLSGEDVYRNHEKLVNQGSALFGAALLWDLAGDDTYEAFHIAQGAGLFGTGMLIDEQGNDTYRGGYFTQGAGNFGSGILLDRKGDDIFHSFCWTQGMGGPWGYGLLADDGGNDTYYAGGKYLHMPLDPDQYRSFAQGFGFGWRDVSCSGGIGFLCDREGNDKYLSEVYGQATSYWFALGLLLDEQGNDLYSAAQYDQGAGIHLSVGGLLDLEGDDHYFSRYGPAQGEGHDLSVGWLWDRDGEDVYYASGGQGIGLTNSVGIFVDTRGNDDYASREALSEGGANPARGTGGVGLFIDLQGDDRYAEKGKGANNHVWTSGITALGMDLEAVPPRKEEWEDTTATFPELDTMKTDTAKIARLFHYASLWQVRADIGKVRTGRRMLRQKFGARPVGFVFNHHFVTTDGLVFEAIEDLFKAYKDTAGAYLFQGLGAKNDTIQRNAIYFLGKLEIKGAGDTLVRMLANPRNDTLAGGLIVALGTLKEAKAVPYIVKYARNKKERTRLRVMVALSDIKDTTGIPTLIQGLSDPSFLVKTGAGTSLASFGQPALGPLEAELERSKKDEQRTILLKTIRAVYQSLGEPLKTEELKKRLAGKARSYLSSGYPALHEQALKLVDEVEGRKVLSPEELFLYPENVK